MEGGRVMTKIPHTGINVAAMELMFLKKNECP